MVSKKYSPIDILVNNAGIQIRGPLKNFEENDLEMVLKTNLSSAFIVSKEIVKSMILDFHGKQPPVFLAKKRLLLQK